MDEKKDNSTSMCYFWCDKCADCIYNKSERTATGYEIKCNKNRYESSFLKRLYKSMTSKEK